MRILVMTIFGIVAGLAVGIGLTYLESVRIKDDFSVAHQFEPSAAPVANVNPTGRAKVTVVNGEKYDFGVMEVDTTLSHAFVFRNDGNAPLTLTKLGTTCKCTISALGQSAIPPGQSAEVTLSWTPKSYAKVFGQTAIETSDPNRSVVRLEVTGHVFPAVRAVPEDIVLSGISADDAKTIDLQLLSYNDENIRFEGYELADPKTAEFFDLEASQLAPDAYADDEFVKSGLLLRLTAKSGLPLGPFQQTIRVKISSKPDAPVEIPIRGTVVGDITIFGKDFQQKYNLLDLGLVPRAEGRRAVLFVTVKGPRRRDVELIARPEDIAPDDVLRVAVGPPQDSARIRKYELTIEIPANSRTAIHSGSKAEDWGQVILTTTHPNIKHVKFYLRFYVAD